MSKRPTGRNVGDLGHDEDATPQARQARHAVRWQPDTWDRLGPPLATPGACWCGSKGGHDWPGKAEGAPHPRDWPGRVNGHGFPT